MFIAVRWIWVTQNSDNLLSIFQSFLFINQDSGAAFFLTAVFALFGFGFVISTLGTFILSVMSYTLGRWHICSGPAVVWDRKARNCLDSLFRHNDIWKQGEFCEHAVLSLAPKSMADWVGRRYEYFMTNFNSVVAIALALIIMGFFLDKKISFSGVTGSCILIVPLFMNMFWSWYTAMNADHLILYNLRRLH